ATGKRPFTGPNTMAVLSSLALDTPPAPSALNPDLPPDFSKLVMRLLEKDKTKRMQTANEVVEELSRLHPPNTVMVVATVQAVPEANPWADIDADDGTNLEAPPLAVAYDATAGSGSANVGPTGSRKRDVASSKSGSRKPLFISIAVGVVL